MNHLGPEGGKAIVKSLEVMIMIRCFRRYRSLSMTANITSLLCMHFCAQVNTSITELDLSDNKLDAEAGKALGKALEVSPIFIVIALSMTANLIFFVFP